MTLGETSADPIAALGTILGVWAHPDDETYLSSGIMAAAARRSARVVCVTATRGEGGSIDEERWPPATLAEVREAELMRCLDVLGVREHHFLDLPDIDMDTALPETHGPDRVRELIEQVRPDTVLTFGPEGMTGHAAHQSICRWTTDAFHAAAPPGSRLYYAAHSTDWAARFLPRMNDLDIFRPGTPVVLSRDRLALMYDLPPDIVELKLRALREHASQVEGVLYVFGEAGLAAAFGQESFWLGAEKPPA